MAKTFRQFEIPECCPDELTRLKILFELFKEMDPNERAAAVKYVQTLNWHEIKKR